MANDTEFGLASCFYSRDLARSLAGGGSAGYGMVGINAGIISAEIAPFSGIKSSGIGREGSNTASGIIWRLNICAWWHQWLTSTHFLNQSKSRSKYR